MSFMNNDTNTNTPSVPSAEPFTSTLPLQQEPSFTNRLIQLPSPVTSGDIPKAVRRSEALSIRCPAPVAVPNLTKKARGRQVPTKEALLKPGTGSARSYSCNVQDCGKVFTRSEHLKRHIRSIHTNEKPFKCEDSNCGKCFTRHDNLLQHQRSHRSPSSISESHSRNSSCDHLSSGPLHRVYTAREPIAPDSAPATLGVLLPSPLSTVPSAAYTTFSVDLVKGKDRITDVSAVDFLSLSTQGSGACVLPQPPYLPCYYGDEHMHTRSVHSPSSMHYQPPFVHISVPIGDTAAKAEPPLEGRKK